MSKEETASSKNNILVIENLTKVYKRGGAIANDNISLRVSAGEVFGLLGHNGAGKTTLLNQIAGLVVPTSGRIRIGGRDPVSDPAMARSVCSLQPQTHAPLSGVTPRQAITIMARIRGASRQRARERTSELLAALDIEEWANVVGERLSGGVRRLTAFCMAAAMPGLVVMFDEPTNDVDPVRRRLLWDQVRALAGQGCAVVLVTHNVSEAERAVDRLVVLDGGRIAAEGRPADLRGDVGGHLRLELVAQDTEAAGHLAQAYTTTRPTAMAGRRVMLTISKEEVTGAVAWAQAECASGRAEEFSLTPMSLDDVYIRLVGSKPQGSRGNAEASNASVVA